jgi:hypothetical protein
LGFSDPPRHPTPRRNIGSPTAFPGVLAGISTHPVRHVDFDKAPRPTWTARSQLVRRLEAGNAVGDPIFRLGVGCLGGSLKPNIDEKPIDLVNVGFQRSPEAPNTEAEYRVPDRISGLEAVNAFIAEF